eukprot:IDg11262t1
MLTLGAYCRTALPHPERSAVHFPPKSVPRLGAWSTDCSTVDSFDLDHVTCGPESGPPTMLVRQRAIKRTHQYHRCHRPPTTLTIAEHRQNENAHISAMDRLGFAASSGFAGTRVQRASICNVSTTRMSVSRRDALAGAAGAAAAALLGG